MMVLFKGSGRVPSLVLKLTIIIQTCIGVVVLKLSRTKARMTLTVYSIQSHAKQDQASGIINVTIIMWVSMLIWNFIWSICNCHIPGSMAIMIVYLLLSHIVLFMVGLMNSKATFDFVKLRYGSQRRLVLKRLSPQFNWIVVVLYHLATV